MAKVMIGCKLPHGLVLEIVTPGEGRRPTPRGDRVILKGANSLREDKRTALGKFDYAVTPVEKEFWDAWLARNKDFEFVRKGFVFEAPNLKDAEAIKAERRDDQTLRTGLEGLDMGMGPGGDGKARDPRLPGAGPMSDGVGTDPESLALAAGGRP